MRILFELNHQVNASSCAITVTCKTPNHQDSYYLDLSSPQKYLLLELTERAEKNFDILVDFNTRDSEIKSTPLEITNIVFDDFYSLPRITHSGQTLLNEECSESSVAQEATAIKDGTGCNTLCFVGTLHYKFSWPFFRLMQP